MRITKSYNVQELEIRTIPEEYADCINAWTKCFNSQMFKRHLSEIINEIIVLPVSTIPLFQLTVNATEQVNGQILKPAEQIMVGRSAKAQIQISEKSVSNRHCLVGSDGSGRFVVRDLGSLNGTFADGRKLTPGNDYIFYDGCKISVGNVPIDIVKMFSNTVCDVQTEIKICPLEKSVYGNTRIKYLLKIGDQQYRATLFIDEQKLYRIALMYFGLQYWHGGCVPMYKPLSDLIISRFLCNLKKTVESKHSLKLEYQLYNNQLSEYINECQKSYILEIQTPFGRDQIEFSLDASHLAEGLQSVLSNTPKDITASLPEHIGKASVTLCCVCPPVVMPYKQAFSLKKEDVILPGLLEEQNDYQPEQLNKMFLVTNTSQDNSLEILCDGKIFNDRIDLTILAVNERNSNMTQDHNVRPKNLQSTTCETSCLDISDRRLVPVQIEIDTLELSIAELSELYVGQILKLKRKIDEPVNVKVNETMIAEGKLVQVGKEFGVELL